MAPSLRDLIDFLLAEIALCGLQGASPKDILSSIDVFYSKSTDHESSRRHVVDRQFQEKVWIWLARNPEVSIGKDREGNGLSLEDAETRQSKTEETTPIRVFVSEERTWLAITGHEPDDTKVLPLEFELLSIIASRQASGISQPELIRISGQDKRSVPKRTDVLQKKGYIEKRAIQMRNARTSLCTLRKFVQAGQSSSETSTRSDADRMIDFKAFTSKLFQILKEYQIISRTDLKDVLGFSDRWHWKVLSRALRKFERIGNLKRVRALSQYAATQKKYHPCVMFVREPTEKDIEMFHDFSKHIYSNMDQGGDAESDDDAEGDDREGDPGSANKIHESGREGDVEVSGRIIPLWSPDRSIHNQVFDAVDRTGTTGCANSDIIRTCFGVFWRRPLENTLARLVECWQVSQPLYLRHLAIVRDTALQRTITHYVHYSARNFTKLVEAGESSWEAVEFVPRNNKSDNLRVPPVDAKPQLDTHGLPLDVPTSDLVKHGDCTLLDCMSVVKPRDYTISSSDPKAVKLEGGGYTIQYGYKQPPSRAAHAQLPDATESTPTTPRRLKFEDREPASEQADRTDRADTVGMKPSMKRKRGLKNYAGMSEKEKLEALGLDETWTEYSVLLIDRPTPGVYITPKGRRRPAGKQRGRPRISRLVVFKSPKLKDLPWFEADKDDSENIIVASQSQGQSQDDSPFAAIARDSVDIATADDTSVVLGKTPPRRASPDETPSPQTPGKRRRTGGTANGLQSARPGSDIIESTPAESIPEMRMVKPQMVNKSKRKRTSSSQSPVGVRTGITEAVSQSAHKLALNQQESNENKRSPPKKTRHTAAAREATEATGPSSAKEDIIPPIPVVDPAVSLNQAQEDSVNSLAHDEERPAVTATISVDTDIAPASLAVEDSATSEGPRFALANGNINIQPHTPSTPHRFAASQISTPEPSAIKWSRSKHLEKGGTVSFLRRKIVLELLEQAGGAFPMGTELWYPFVTAWLKTKYKEKPDMRTLKNAVKQLVDAGKVRQQTFCGKDRKGVMVTKTLICKAELSPDDPFIRNMQKEILKTEARHYFPPNVEIDPILTKQGRTRGLRHAVDVPREESVTVQLHQKPASIAAMEKRKGSSIQRQLMKKIELEQMRESMQETRPSGVVRLLSIARPEAHGASLPDTALATRTGSSTGRRRVNGHIGARPKRHHIPVSLIASYAMLMNPSQTYDPVTGTFSTNAGISARMARAAQSRGPYAAYRRDPHVPYSLADLFTQAGRRQMGMADEIDPRSKKFFKDQDAILRWELRNEGLLQQRTEELRYITQTIPDAFETVPIEGDIRFTVDRREQTPVEKTPKERKPRGRRIVRNQQHLRELLPAGTFVHEEYSPFPQHPAYEDESDLDEPEFASYPFMVSQPFTVPQMFAGTDQLVNTVTSPQPQHHDFQFIEDGTAFTKPYPITEPRNTKNRRLEKLNELVATGNEPISAQNRQPSKRNRVVLALSRSMYQRLLAAIVVVRALAGGSEGKNIEWPLVPRCFPNDDPKFVIDKGKGLLAKNRLQIAKMQSDFQERYLVAYANGEVPPIDYDDLEAYDWERVMEWANNELDIPKWEKLPDLPATREQFDDLFELREDVPNTLDEIYQNQAITLNRKRTMISHIAFATTLSSKPTTRPRHDTHLSPFDTLKTWVRANVLTPAEVYRPADARAALAYIDRGSLDSALQSLVTERVISQSNKGRIVPGRNYDITDFFIQTLSKRRPIEVTELRRAVIFKTSTLDIALREQGFYSVPYNAEDGDILALINLLSAGKVTIKPRDAPREKFGLTDGGYLTRMIDKGKLRFPVDIYPVENTYISGNPILEMVSKTPPPCPPCISISPTLTLPEKIPLWFDIHGGLIKTLWELALVAVLGAVAVRPGITASGVSGMVKPCLGVWEVELMLGWLEEVGAARRTGLSSDRGDEGDSGTGNGRGMDKEDSWCVLEWWWLALS
ncbi:hypothetical protein BJY04DRAFT_229542 [Aspergillus karnatakaensis]|uniref:putative TFIIIC transcription initiation factor complex subunits Tfc3 n=1 Tax=Aspergillus karnatakaensis TaxID=1810916 RepID=UPI003CCCEDFD